WQRFLNSLSPNSRSRTKRRRPSCRPRLEGLEDRLAPAITVLDGGAGTLDGLLGPSQGAITAAQSAGNQTLSRAALQAAGSTTNISITSDVITFNALSSTLPLQPGAGNSAPFTTTTGAISFNNTANTFTTAGGSITFSAGADLTIANISSGGGDVSLTV